jgi:Fe-Mn family superoxide dismutase
MSFELPALPYKYTDLEPVIDALTVEIHYAKHHAAYTRNLNAALEKYPQFYEKPIEKILSDLGQIPEDVRTAVRNNGGGYYNHILYWENLRPVSNVGPLPKLATAIDKAFSSFSAFKEQMEKAGASRFGSGWAWLSKKPTGELIIHSTANQETPLADGLLPILTIDVWEHAYYLKYQNKRADYLAAIWQIINWERAEQRFLA